MSRDVALQVIANQVANQPTRSAGGSVNVDRPGKNLKPFVATTQQVQRYASDFNPETLNIPTPQSVRSAKGLDRNGDQYSYKVVTFPDGSQFAMTQEGKPFVTDRDLDESTKSKIRLQLDPNSDGSFTNTGIEVDHMISKFLGGTDVESNLQPLRGKLSVGQQIQKFLFPKKFELESSKPSVVFEPDERQDGKYVVEQEAFKKMDNGEITFLEAMAAVQNWDNNKLRNQFLHNEVEPSWTEDIKFEFNPLNIFETSGLPLKDNFASSFFREQVSQAWKKSYLGNLIKAVNPVSGDSIEDRTALLRGASLGVDKFYDSFDPEKDDPDELAKSGFTKAVTPIFSLALGMPLLSGPPTVPSKTEVEAAATLPVRWFSGGLTRFVVGGTLEYFNQEWNSLGMRKVAQEARFTPQTEKEIMLLGRGDIAAFSQSTDLYGLGQQLATEKLENAGISHTEAQATSFGMMIGLGLIFENPFMDGLEKPAQEGLERITKEALERELGGELTEEVIEQIAKDVPEVLAKTDPISKKEAYQKLINKFNNESSLKPVGEVVEKQADEAITPLVAEAKKYGSVEEFNSHGFDEILRDLRGVERDTVVTIPTNKVEIKWKQDYDNALTTARKDYNPKTAEPVDLIYDFKKDRYILDDGHNRFVAAQRNDKPISGVVQEIEGNMVELADLYKKERGRSLTDIWNQAVKETPAVVETKPTLKFEPTAKINSDVDAVENFNLYEIADHKSQYYLPPPSGKKLTKSEGKVLGETFVLAGDGKKSNLGFTKRTLNKEKQEIQKAATELGQVLSTPGELKDISNISLGLKDVYRNFEHVFGDKFPSVKKLILDPFDKSKGEFVDTMIKITDELDQVIIKDLGIKKGSKESRAVQRYGEGLITKADLVSEFGENRAKNIMAADRWFRKQYDILLDEVNVVRKQMYPNDPAKQIPKRKNYYRHFQDIKSDIQGLLNVFETPAAIDPKLAGISEYTKPRSKFLSFAQRRLGGKTKEDAVGGFLNYIPSYSYAVNIDPHISNFRSLGRDLAEATVETKNTNNFIRFLDLFSNDLAGKTNAADRFVNDFIPGGRVSLRALDWMNKRVKANTILGNVSSSIAQIFNVPQGIGSAKIHSLEGMGNTLAQIWKKGTPIERSNFIKERYFDSFFGKFDQGVLNNTKRFSAWMIGALDEVGTKFIWNAHYAKAIRTNIDDPIKFADDITRQMVGGRGVGEVPILQKSKVVQMVAPFQLEVQNLWWVLQGMYKKKDISGLMTTFVALFLMNKAAESIRGSGVAFDPIDAMIDAGMAYSEAAGEGEYGRGVMLAGGRLSGEVLGNVMFGQTIASMYPENGFKLGEDERTMTRKELFGDQDPTRFGSGPLFVKGLQDPLYSLLPGFGGKQVKKSIAGVSTFMDGTSETATGLTRFEVDQTPTNFIKSVLFGEYASNNAREYFETGGKPVSETTYHANQIISDLEELKTDEEKRDYLKESIANGTLTEDVYKKMTEIQEEAALDLTRKERALKNSSLDSRAETITEEIAKLKTFEERKKYLIRLIEIGVITESLFEKEGFYEGIREYLISS